MKTNFKTLALQAGIGAALAAGSMTASAAITAVPAPAQLVPLFYYAGTGTTSSFTGVDTGVRVIVPKSVGSDTVINILRGDSGLTAQTNWNSGTQNFTTAANNYIHYWVMDVNSSEIFNSRFPVTADDECYFYASQVLAGLNGAANSSCFNSSTTGSFISAGVATGEPTYLLLTNESALNGGSPTFLFSADAWLENPAGNADMATSVYIPVLGLADGPDNTDFVTPGNNVIEVYPGAGPIASPIHTGIRTSGTGAVGGLRVVDVPVHNAVNDTSVSSESNITVVWTDKAFGGGTSYSAPGSAYTNIKQYNCNEAESCVSQGTISFPTQLNLFEVGNADLSDVTGIVDNYANGAVSATNLTTGGFIKWVIPAVALPAGAGAAGAEAGAYSAISIFNIPANPGVSGNDTDSSELAVDTGWFTGQ